MYNAGTMDYSVISSGVQDLIEASDCLSSPQFTRQRQESTN